VARSVKDYVGKRLLAAYIDKLVSTVPGCKAMTQQPCRAISSAAVRVAWFCAAFVIRYEYLTGQMTQERTQSNLSPPPDQPGYNRPVEASTLGYLMGEY